jgi:hypothetical protein
VDGEGLFEKGLFLVVGEVGGDILEARSRCVCHIPHFIRLI